MYYRKSKQKINRLPFLRKESNLREKYVKITVVIEGKKIKTEMSFVFLPFLFGKL